MAGSAGRSEGRRRPRVLLTDHPWPECDVERAIVEAAGLELVTGASEAAPASEIQRFVAEQDPVAILTCWAPVSAQAIAAPTDLRIVARMGVGLDNIDVAAATARKAWVTNVPDYCVEEVSDHALALILAWLRGVVVLDREVKSGRWQPGGAKVGRFRVLTVGLIGLGRIGRATVRKLAGFGCRIIATDPSPAEPPAGVEKVSLDVLRAEADIIVLHVPLIEATRHLVNEAFIDGCRKKPFLVNVSRGGLVDNAALVRALDAGKLAGAGLDVVEGEPEPPASVVGRPDILVTPHVAFLSPASLLELRRRSTEEVLRVLQGAPPHFPCNAPKIAERVLGGGVASDIRVVGTIAGQVVVKEALPELKVEAYWPSDPIRSSVEVEALTTIAALLGEGVVPKVLWTDREKHRFGMELVDPRLRNWKQDLLDGRIDLATAFRAGQLLGQMHGRSSREPVIAVRFSNQRFFEELRIRPFLQRVAERNPSLSAAIGQSIDGMCQSFEKALVHGDFSPKNILADGRNVVLLDCEVAHWGDPRFDLAFCLSHLSLKATRRGADAGKFADATEAFLAGYQEEGPAVIDAALVRLVGGLILARLEGDSPVDYLNDLDTAAAKRVASAMIESPSADPGFLVKSIRESHS
jgi:phosphoglycerate dehydrogenase-like enzyme